MIDNSPKTVPVWIWGILAVWFLELAYVHLVGDVKGFIILGHRALLDEILDATDLEHEHFGFFDDEMLLDHLDSLFLGYFHLVLVVADRVPERVFHCPVQPLRRQVEEDVTEGHFPHVQHFPRVRAC